MIPNRQLQRSIGGYVAAEEPQVVSLLSAWRPVTSECYVSA